MAIEKIFHMELGGGYSMRKKVVLSTILLPEGDFETMAIHEDGEELACIISPIYDEAEAAFRSLVEQFAEPQQLAFYRSNLVPGQHYTMLRFSEFGFPQTVPFTLCSVKFGTYAQHSDVVFLKIRRKGCRSEQSIVLDHGSVMIFRGWQSLDPDSTVIVTQDTGTVRTTTISKYACFDHRFLEDAEKSLKDPVVIFKDYRQAPNGKVYG